MRMAAALSDVVRKRGKSVATVKALLKRNEPHRAILRELILEDDPDLNPYGAIVKQAVKVVPELKRWAATPR